MFRASSWTYTGHPAHAVTLPLLLCDIAVNAVYGRAELSDASFCARPRTCTSVHSRKLD